MLSQSALKARVGVSRGQEAIFLQGLAVCQQYPDLWSLNREVNVGCEEDGFPLNNRKKSPGEVILDLVSCQNPQTREEMLQGEGTNLCALLPNKFNMKTFY